MSARNKPDETGPNSTPPMDPAEIRRLQKKVNPPANGRMSNILWLCDKQGRDSDNVARQIADALLQEFPLGYSHDFAYCTEDPPVVIEAKIEEADLVVCGHPEVIRWVQSCDPTKPMVLRYCADQPASGLARVVSERLRERAIIKPAPHIFRNRGDTWEITHDGQSTTVKNSLGMEYIHYLVKNVKTPAECIDIERACGNGAVVNMKTVRNEEALDADLRPDTLKWKQLDKYDVETIRSAKSKCEIEWESDNNPARKAELAEQVYALTEYLKKNLNIHGQPRPTGPL